MNEQDYILKVFQLRAARDTAGIELATIGNLIGFTKAGISFWEQKNDFCKLKTSNQNIITIKEFFAQHNIFFPDEHSIVLKSILVDKKREGLTRFQLRAARVILRLTQEELARSVNVSEHIIKHAELSINNRYIYMRAAIKRLPIELKSFFESKNLFFEGGLKISFFENKKSS